MVLKRLTTLSSRSPKCHMYIFLCLSVVVLNISGEIVAETENRASIDRPEVDIRVPEPETTCFDILFKIEDIVRENNLELIKLKQDLIGIMNSPSTQVRKRGKQDDVFIPSGLDNLDRMTSILDKFQRMSVKSMTMKSLRDKMRKMGRRK